MAAMLDRLPWGFFSLGQFPDSVHRDTNGAGYEVFH